MVIVVFEFEPDESLKDRYFELAAILLKEVEKIDGFISVERFESISNPGCYVSLSTWQDMAAVNCWREQLDHSQAQNEAKTRKLFLNIGFVWQRSSGTMGQAEFTDRMLGCC